MEKAVKPSIKNSFEKHQKNPAHRNCHFYVTFMQQALEEFVQALMFISNQSSYYETWTLFDSQQFETLQFSAVLTVKSKGAQSFKLNFPTSLCFNIVAGFEKQSSATTKESTASKISDQ